MTGKGPSIFVCSRVGLGLTCPYFSLMRSSFYLVPCTFLVYRYVPNIRGKTRKP
jgi:hypothetical protein